jgi:hypothetical protein
MNKILRASIHDCASFANVPCCAWNNRLEPMQYLDRLMLSDLPSFKLPVPHLGQDNMVRNNKMPYLLNSNYLRQWSRSMSQKSCISCMGGGAVQAIRRVTNEKRLLLIMVGINIILSFGKEYVKWEFTGKPGQENWDF